MLVNLTTAGEHVRRVLTETLRKRETRRETEAEKGRPPQCGLKHHIAMMFTILSQEKGVTEDI